MNILSLLSFSNFICFMFTAIYSLKVNIKSKLNQFAFLLCMSLAIWLFSYTFFYVAESKEEAWLWHKLGSIGWCNFASFTVYFFLVHTRFNKKFTYKWQQVLFYIIPLILIIKNWVSSSTVVAQDLVKSSSGLGWIYVNSTTSIWLWIYILYLTTYFGVGLFLLYKWGKQSNYFIEKKQPKIIIIIDTILIFCGLFTDIVLPILNNSIPPIANIMLILFIIGFWFIIGRYNIFSLSNIASSDTILDTIMDPVILLDANCNILRCNQATDELLEYNKDDIINKGLTFILE